VGGALAEGESAREDVAQAPAPGREQGRDEGGHADQGPALDGSREGAHEGLPEALRAAVIPDYAQAQGHLPQGPPAGQRLEDQRVSHDDEHISGDKYRGDPRGINTRAGREADCPQDDDHQYHLHDHVDKVGEHPGGEPRARQFQDYRVPGDDFLHRVSLFV
jgi:hypothetical protein